MWLITHAGPSTGSFCKCYLKPSWMQRMSCHAVPPQQATRQSLRLPKRLPGLLQAVLMTPGARGACLQVPPMRLCNVMAWVSVMAHAAQQPTVGLLCALIIHNKYKAACNLSTNACMQRSGACHHNMPAQQSAIGNGWVMCEPAQSSG